MKIPHYVMGCAAWSTMSPNGRAAYLEVKRLYNGSNNGSISLGTRQLAKKMNRGNDTAARALSELVDLGFVEVTVNSNFDHKHGVVREFRLTEYPDDRPGMPLQPTKEFMRWQPHDAENQNPVAPVRRSVAPVVPSRFKKAL